jgi:hypothetical protein
MHMIRKGQIRWLQKDDILPCPHLTTGRNGDDHPRMGFGLNWILFTSQASHLPGAHFSFFLISHELTAAGIISTPSIAVPDATLLAVAMTRDSARVVRAPRKPARLR